MSDPHDNDKPSDPAGRIEELVSAIRTALASEASADARSAGVTACRAILRTLEPSATRNGPMLAPTSPLAGSPIGAALGALGSIPREQVVGFLVTGLRSVFGQGASPTYRSPPARPPAAPNDRSG
jgi:hypothetical protein